MNQHPDDASMTTYQFDVDSETWDDWKQTVPRDKSLEQRIIELIEADTDGRVRESSVPTRRSQAADKELQRRESAAADGFGGVVADARAEWADDPDARRQARVDSLRAAIEAVCEEPLSKSELQAAAYPGESVGQNERTWFRKTVKPWLKEVAEYSNTDQKWHYSG